MDEMLMLQIARALEIPLPWKTCGNAERRLETVEGREAHLFRLIWRRFIIELAEEIEHSRVSSQREKKRKAVGLDA